MSNICISFAVLETFFVMAFVFSWHFNGNNGNNSKTVFFLILVGYLFCSGGVVTAIRMSDAFTYEINLLIGLQL